MTLPANLTAAPSLQVRPMTKTETAIFIDCELRTPKPDPVPAAELRAAIHALEVFVPDKFNAYPPAQSFLNHVGLTNALYDPGMAALAIGLCKTPGQATLWAWTIYQRTLELGRPYTINDFTFDFPMGPPTDAASLAIWDAQKGKGPCAFFPLDTDNLLDIADTWKVKELADAE